MTTSATTLARNANRVQLMKPTTPAWSVYNEAMIVRQGKHFIRNTEGRKVGEVKLEEVNKKLANRAKKEARKAGLRN